MTVNLGDSKLLRRTLQLTFESEMTGSPKIYDFKSCVPRAYCSSCSGPKEALGTTIPSPRSASSQAFSVNAFRGHIGDERDPERISRGE